MNQNITLGMQMLIRQKLKDYQQLMKLSLSMLVVMSSLVGYAMVPDLEVTLLNILWLFLGGTLVTAAANASNQLLESKSDKVMKRTMNRPLPDMRMGQLEAFIFIGVCLVAGVFILYFFFNKLSAVLSLISFLMYVFAYTPLKKVSSISVLVGAIPGSMPCLIGWAAATNHIGSIAAWTLFIIQFFWQFPHFWSIAWLAHEDYTKAGMKMLPHKEKTGQFTAFQCVLYSAVLLPLSALPMLAGLGSWISFTGLFIAALWLLYHSFAFLKNNSDAMARNVMFASFVYLPMILLSLLFDKYF